MEVRPGDRLRVRPGGWGRLGEAVAEVDGTPLFVFGALPGEEVVVEVTRRLRRHLSGRVAEVVEGSPDRVPAPCAYFGRCSGCQWQHLDYARQIELKRRAVSDALERVGGLEAAEVHPTIPAPSPWGYRNHARFTVGRNGRLGFVNRSTREFVDVEHCMLMHPEINRVLRALQGTCQETTQLAIRYGVATGDVMVQPRLHDARVPVASGRSHYREELQGRRFRVASPSFFQVNTAQAARLADLVREGLRLGGGEVVVDAYAGVGVLGVLLGPFARRVIALEEAEPAIEDARENAAGVHNLELRRGRVEELLPRIPEPVDGVVLDPPRAGCRRPALDELNRLAPPRVAYVSCDPEAMARDLRVLVEGPFALEEVQPLDMFPQTHHVECVALLRGPGGSRRAGDG